MEQLSEPLNSTHKKSDFSCGMEILDTYIHKQANQDIKRKLSACFVLSRCSLWFDRLTNPNYTFILYAVYLIH